MSKHGVQLVCGGKFHDFAHVEKEITQLLNSLSIPLQQPRHSYESLDSLSAVHGLITYTADLLPDSEVEDQLDQFLKQGGRWLALHGTNSKVIIDERGYADSPRIDSKFMHMLGSQFLAHPPKQDFSVEVAAPNHPLTAGIEPFIVNDELYFIDERGELEVLLHAESDGRAMRGFKQREYPSNKPHPIMYLRKWGEGQVLYLNLGHSRGHYDMQPLVDYYEPVERGSWESPVFRELLNRSVKWLVSA